MDSGWIAPKHDPVLRTNKEMTLSVHSAVQGKVAQSKSSHNFEEHRKVWHPTTKVVILPGAMPSLHADQIVNFLKEGLSGAF